MKELKNKLKEIMESELKDVEIFEGCCIAPSYTFKELAFLCLEKLKTQNILLGGYVIRYNCCDEDYNITLKQLVDNFNDYSLLKISDYPQYEFLTEEKRVYPKCSLGKNIDKIQYNKSLDIIYYTCSSDGNCGSIYSNLVTNIEYTKPKIQEK